MTNAERRQIINAVKASGQPMNYLDAFQGGLPSSSMVGGGPSTTMAANPNVQPNTVSSPPPTQIKPIQMQSSESPVNTGLVNSAGAMPEGLANMPNGSPGGQILTESFANGGVKKYLKLR